MESRKPYCSNCFRMLPIGKQCPYCGFDNAQEEKHRGVALPLYTVLDDRFILGRVLGAGGFGITYLALDRERNISFAIKEYFPVDICVRNRRLSVIPTEREKAFERYKASFAREGRLLQTMAACPYVVDIDAYFDDFNTAYIVMEYVEGQNLREFAAQQGGVIPYQMSALLTLNIASGLSSVHKKRILHRDVNPKNVLIASSGDVKLIDFGAARMGFQKSNKSTSIKVTEGYAPPEQYYSSGKQGPWTDVYALGCTFYRLVSGTRPQPALERQKDDRVQPLYKLCKDVEKPMSLVIQRAMQLDSSARYQSMDEFANAFAAAFGTSAIPSTSAWLTVLGGPQKGMHMSLPNHAPKTVGRIGAGRNADIEVSNQPIVSGIHCVFTYDRENNCVQIEDRSRNGTTLDNGIHLQGHTLQVFHDTTLRLSNSDALIRIEFRQKEW